MIITILIFIVILGILVFVHEFGHFIVAKKSGMRVEEFGFGFPPRIAGIQKVSGKWRWVWAYRVSSKSTTPSRQGGTPLLSQEGNTAAPHLFADGKTAELSPPLGEMPSASEAERVQLSGGTIYSINAIPLGGFVRILGENNEAEEHPGSFINKGFWPRLLTLVAGVVMNVILAWVLLSVGYIVGLPVGVSSVSDIPAHTIFSNPQMTITLIVPGQPADKAGLKADDVILKIDNQSFSQISDIQNYVLNHEGKSITFDIQRGRQNLNIPVTPKLNPGPNQGPTGIELSLVGNLKFKWYYAVWEGAKSTVIAIGQITGGLYQLFTGKLGLAGVGGPVKIAQLVGVARQYGFMALLNLTIMLSLSLAVLNILPFPALDGGRVLFLIIEKVRRKRNNQKVEQIVNTAGFIFLILLMAAVTVHDIIRK
jgi:regulator of sigma E protease